MPFGFHLAMDTLPSGELTRNSTFFPLSGQRGITPAFGYDAPHLGARGTSTLLNNVLLSTHYAAVRLPLAVPEGLTAPRVLLPAHRVALGATTGSPGSRAWSFSACFGVWDSARPL